MSSPSRLTRLLALVPWLAAHDGITVAEAAEHFDVTVEQLEQDLWLLIVCGLPGYGPADLVDIQFWDDGRIHVLDAQTLQRPLRLTADEATALLLGLRVLQQVPGAAPTEALDRAVGKLDAAIEVAIQPTGVEVTVQATDAAVAAALEAAMEQGDALAITYAAATRDELSERVVQPLRITSVDGRSSLLAYCSAAQAVRTFRIDRILSAHPVAPIAVPESTHVAPASPQGEVVLLLGPSARWIAEVHGATVLAAGTSASDGTDGDGEAVRVALSVHDHAWLARLVLGAGPEVTVISPPEAVAAVRAAAEAALGAYA